MEKTLQRQLEINRNQLEINKQHVINSEQHQSQFRQQPRLQRTQQQLLPKNSRVLPKHRSQQVQRVQSNREQLPKARPQQRVLQETTPNPPSTSEPVITIPFDSGSAENIITEVNGTGLDPIYMDGATADFSLPVVVEVPSIPLSPAQTVTSPAALSPHDLLISNPVLTPQVEPSPVVESPAEPHNDEMQVACVEDAAAASPNFLTRSAHQHIFKIDQSDYSRSEMDNHIDTVQNDLDSLKELLRSEGISLDANTLLGYFNDDPLFYNMSDPNNGEETKESSGNELMTCNPSFDFSDLIGNDWSLPTSPGDNLMTAGPTDDSFAEVNTPQFVPQSPTFPTPSKKRKK